VSWRRLALVGYAALVGLAISNASCSRGDATAAQNPAAAQRIVTIGGAVSETVFALGAGERVVATDTSTTFPPEAAQRPKVGYQRSLAAETVLAYRPDLIIASPEAGPATTLAQLRAAGVRIELVGEAHDGETAAARIVAIGALLGKAGEAEKLAAPVAAVVPPAPSARPPRVLFLYARGGGVAMVAGTPSPISGMIELGGGVNAVTEFAGYKQLSGEAVIAAAPDIILLPERGLAAIGGPDRLWEMPGMAHTPAGAAKRVVAIEDLLLLGFGPRLATAAAQLRTAFAVGR
jgi:iron complex transport system substrate-binding protein